MLSELFTMHPEEYLRVFENTEELVTQSWSSSDDLKFTLAFCYDDALKEFVDEFMEQCLYAWRALPNAWLIERIIVVPADKLDAPIAKQNKGSRYFLLIGLPYTEVSLRQNLLEMYGEILADLLPLNRYLFELAYFLQPALREESPTFRKSSALWNFLIASFATQPLTDTELKARPLLSYLALDAIVCSLGHSAERVTAQTRATFESMKERLGSKALPVVLDKLLHLSNEARDIKVQQSACKLLLHLAGAEHIALVRNIRSLNLSGEAVGERILQQLKHLKCIEELDLSDCYFPSEALRHLAKLPHLYMLNLQNTRAHNNAVAALSESASIAQLDCSYTQVTDDGAKHFSSFKNLKQLDLSGCQVSEKMRVFLRQNGLEILP